ncbi:MAG: response regulator [Myxococcota bacterium]|nr:response regulator [Myxococcota bacterium]
MGIAPNPPRILIVDDEEAILETMSFTFMDLYETFTSSSASEALKMLDENSPIACVITDQRMPGLTGVEFLAEASRRHPDTVRIMLTGFADVEATIQAINDGHVYAYVTKPWEPDELKQTVKRAVEHNQLATENSRLVAQLSDTNYFLEAVMDRLDTGALAVDAHGIVRAANRPAREHLDLGEDPRGTSMVSVLEKLGIETLGDTVMRLLDEPEAAFEDVQTTAAGTPIRLRISAQRLEDVGCVVLFKEISHEPLRRRFDEILAGIQQAAGELRPGLEAAIGDLGELAGKARELRVSSPRMAELNECVSRTQTAIQNWLDVDDIIASEEYPDAQILLDRMRVASQRWPDADGLPGRVQQLHKAVETYYESGENPRKRAL